MMHGWTRTRLGAHLGRWIAAGFMLMGLAGSPASAAGLQRLEIDTASGRHVYKVEVMRTEAERGHGLMNRRSMPRDHGMLFDFHEERPVWFWMKDTYIPLDMIFVSQAGRVVSIKRDAQPLDETLIPSGAPTLGVIELNAGQADAIGVAVGDTVKNPIFGARR